MVSWFSTSLLVSSRCCVLSPGRLLDRSLAWFGERKILPIVKSAVFATQAKARDMISGYSKCPWMTRYGEALDKDRGSASAVIHFFTSSDSLIALRISEPDIPSQRVSCIGSSCIAEQCKTKLDTSTRTARSRDRKLRFRDCKF